MSIRLKADESILTQCQLQEFTATLTTTRLIIVSPVSEENFPLRGLSGVGVYDDVEKYNANSKAEKKKVMSITMGMCSGVGLLFVILLPSNGFYSVGLLIMIGLLLIGFVIASTYNPTIRLESILNIMQHGGSRQFRFHKTDRNAADIKSFIEQVTETLS